MKESKKFYKNNKKNLHRLRQNKARDQLLRHLPQKLPKKRLKRVNKKKRKKKLREWNSFLNSPLTSIVLILVFLSFISPICSNPTLKKPNYVPSSILIRCLKTK
jgi:hypothetical protein